jgi:hypothetical protein
MRFITIVLGSLATASAAAQDFDRAGPLLVRRCLECHSGAQPKGKLDLSTSRAAAKVIEPGNPAESVLWQRVDAGEMPPKTALTADEKKLLRSWIEQGAKWGAGPLDWFAQSTEHRAGYDWWSLQSIRRPELPRIARSDSARNPLDRFILEKLEDKGLAPSPEADRRTLLRRLKLDLLGLPPTPDEIDAFGHDDRPDAYETLVDRLLASPLYGERWARHWLDIVRFGESNGFEYDELRKNAWHYRDWVIAAFNEDMPYDEFVRRQIAGDVRAPDDPRGSIAAGFLVVGGYDSVGQKQQSVAMKAAVRQDELEDIIGVLGQTFLGLTLQCARCHDHKFDPIRQTEYYRLSAALAGVRHGERELTDAAALAAHERGQKRLKDAQDELARLEAPIRARILAQRKNTSAHLETMLPPPMARWDFTKGLQDSSGKLDATLHGDARLTAQGLVLSGKGYASTSPLRQTIRTRTMAARVMLGNLDQRGGGVMTLQNLDGSVFDAIVFAERDPRQWLAGSDFFKRTLAFSGPPESDTKRSVHLAHVYRDDGHVTAYRNGVPYGASIKTPATAAFQANTSQILFGLRHSPAGGNKHLTGVIHDAALYDQPLSPAEIAALAGEASEFVSDAEILSLLSADAKSRRESLRAEIVELNAAFNTMTKPRVYTVVPTPPEATFVLLRGEPGRKGAEVAPGGVQAAGIADFGLSSTALDAERRLRLAAWMTSERNPLLARVMVNRLWHYHFGAGLIETPSDFGFNGGRPSHPELLDWLADEFRRSGYRVKHMHRLLITSAAYRQASRYRPDASKLDGGNRLLWRKSPVRLEAEVLRDAVLSVAGKLNAAGGGPGYQDFKMTIRGATYYYTPHEDDSPEHCRRTVYRTWVRSGRHPLLDTLDCPDPSTATPRRTVTTTPLQALSLLNSDFMLRMADHFARRVEREAGTEVAPQIVRAYSLALGRPPDRQEAELARTIVARHGLAILCRALFNSNEFMYAD